MLTLGLMGCLGRGPDVHHFMLGTTDAVATSARAPDLAVLVGPVRLPAYLERTQIVTLEPGGEIELDESHRWLGGFETNFLRALSLGLAGELGSTRVVVHPSKAPFTTDYQIRLHVDDMIFESGRGLRVRVRWALIPSMEGAQPMLFVMDELTALDRDSAEDIVGAYQDATTELVRRIADQLVALADRG